MTAYSLQSGASVIAEDNPKLKVDENWAFDSRDKRKFVLRTTFNSEDILKLDTRASLKTTYMVAQEVNKGMQL